MDPGVTEEVYSLGLKVPTFSMLPSDAKMHDRRRQPMLIGHGGDMIRIFIGMSSNVPVPKQPA